MKAWVAVLCWCLAACVLTGVTHGFENGMIGSTISLIILFTVILTAYQLGAGTPLPATDASMEPSPAHGGPPDSQPSSIRKRYRPWASRYSTLRYHLSVMSVGVVAVIVIVIYAMWQGPSVADKRKGILINSRPRPWLTTIEEDAKFRGVGSRMLGEECDHEREIARVQVHRKTHSWISVFAKDLGSIQQIVGKEFPHAIVDICVPNEKIGEISRKHGSVRVMPWIDDQ